jgi:protein O-mannosyl-transferase
MIHLASKGLPAAVIITIAVAISFANVLGNSWHYDDLHSITQNPHLQSLQEPLRFLLDPTQFSRDADKAMFRPLLLTSFAINYAWSGLETWSWHIVNIALHLACTLVLWHILRDLGRSGWQALVGALLFGLHPLATEPVNYISSRSESLAALFVLGAFWFHVRAHATQGRQDRLWRTASVVLFALGVLTKSVAITTPALLLAFDGLRLGWRRALTPATWLPYIVVAAAYLTIVGAHVSRAVVSDAVRGPWEQLATQAKALPYYARLLAFPVGLNVHHQFFAGGTFLVVVLALAAVVSLLYVGLRRAPRDVTFGLVWIAVILSPTVVVPLHVLVNDHRLYLPMAGVVLALSSITATVQRAWLGRAALLLLALLAVTTWQRNRIWENEFTLWSDAAAKSPTPLVPVAYVHLGNYAKDAGQLAAAERYFRRALEISPDHVAARNNLGIILQGLDRVAEAIAIYQDITLDRPDVAEGWYNLGKAHQQVAQKSRRDGNSEAALESELLARRAYLRAPADGPHDHVILNNLGTTFENSSRVDSAVIYYRRSLALRPDHVDARRNVTRLLQNFPARASGMMERGQFIQLETLCAHLAPAAKILQKNDPWPLFFLAVSRFSRGLYADSVEPNRQLVSQFPGFEEGYLQLGNVYETLQDPEGAAAVYEQQLLRIPKGTHAAEAAARLRRLKEAPR